MGKKSHEEDPSSVKYHVKKILTSWKEQLTGKMVIDFPAGSGVTSRILRDLGANPVAFDLFPEYFQLEGLTCQRADIRSGIPVEDEVADALVCQEGIEHFSDQYQAFREFNRVLKQGGLLLMTTPNYSNLRSKISYLLSESERYNRHMPPNEIDSIWMADPEISNEIYFGHIFLIGIQKLRVLGRVSGFTIRKIHLADYKLSSLIYFPFIYPFIVFSNLIAYRKNLRKHKGPQQEQAKEIYKEIVKISLNPKILLGGILIVEFEKVESADKVTQSLRSRDATFGLT
ncbi:class I SAM-dependent methyltransferase [Bacteroidota bacterium]